MSNRLTQTEMLEIVIDDLKSWAYGNDSDDSMMYALRNGYRLHAANLWLGSGAASDDVCKQINGLKISHTAEMREIKSICKHAHIYVCPDCNHHGFYDNDEGETVQCFSCNKTALKKVE